VKRVIPILSLDSDARLIDSVSLPSSDDALDLVAVADAYAEAGAGELIIDARQVAFETLAEVAKRLFTVAIPFALRIETSDPDRAAALLTAGAARVFVGSAGLADPDLIARLSKQLGSDSVGVWMTARPEGTNWRVLESLAGGDTEWDAVNWAAVAEAQGAGELVAEAVGSGDPGEPFDLELLKRLNASFRRPVLAAGAAMRVEDLFDALMIGAVDGVLVGELLHSGGASLAGIKHYLADHGLDETGSSTAPT
jgi:cyclase